jgi:hypothetical protein
MYLCITGAITEEDPEGGTLVAAPGALLLKARHTAALKDLKQRYDELDKEGIDWEAFLRWVAEESTHLVFCIVPALFSGMLPLHCC